MDELPHGGGVVFRPAAAAAAPEFLVVQAKREPSQWVLPKGHIEAGETPDQTAVREVREEAGVVAQAIEALGDTTFMGPRGEVRTRFFLMRFVATVAPDEDRPTEWLPYDAALARLTFDDQRDILFRARGRIERQ